LARVGESQRPVVLRRRGVSAMDVWLHRAAFERTVWPRHLVRYERGLQPESPHLHRSLLRPCGGPAGRAVHLPKPKKRELRLPGTDAPDVNRHCERSSSIQVIAACAAGHPMVVIARRATCSISSLVTPECNAFRVAE